jgi:hypothetical protein
MPRSPFNIADTNSLQQPAAYENEKYREDLLPDAKDWKLSLLPVSGIW